MTDLIARAERVLRHSQRFYLRLCASCDRPVVDGDAGCDHRDQLLAQARTRHRTFLDHPRTAWSPCVGPWLQPPLAEVGLAWPEASKAPLREAARRRAG
jgi:hypothetical protein